MRSRADALGVVALGLQGLGVACAAWAAWSLVRPRTVGAPSVTVTRDAIALEGRGALGGAAAPLAALAARAPGETLRVTLAAAPAPALRGTLRALADAGHPLLLATRTPLAPLAVAARVVEGPAAHAGVLAVAGDTTPVAVADAAGTLDSVPAPASLRAASLAGAVRVRAGGVQASALPVTERPRTRVLVAGGAAWESRFVVAALEEAGWQVDAALAVSPTVTVRQGTSLPDRARHAAVIVLEGAGAAVSRALPTFVRAGGGAVLVGGAARAPALAALRAGAPGATLRGEAGQEGSDVTPRRGLDLVPVSAVARTSVALERRDGAVAIAARRVGAGRVVQVGYADSWRWRMAGADDAPDAHRRWWSALVASVAAVPLPPAAGRDALHDTLDPVPVAALVQALGPVRASPAAPAAVGDGALPDVDPRLVGLAALAALATAWALRRIAGRA